MFVFVPLKRRGQLRVEVADTATRADLADALNKSLAELIEVFDTARSKADAGLSEFEVECALDTDPDGGLVIRNGGTGLFRVRMTWSASAASPRPPGFPAV